MTKTNEQADVQPVAIQRYDSSNSCGEGIMVPHPNGDYVEYDHHAAAIAQLEAERDEAVADTLAAEAELRIVRSKLEKAELALAEMHKGPPLCDDEGCPHHGTVHICSDSETQRLQRLVSSSEAERYRSCGELLTALTVYQREKEGLRSAAETLRDNHATRSEDGSSVIVDAEEFQALLAALNSESA